MNRSKSLLVALAVLLVLTSIFPVFAQDKIQVTWFCCLGTGDNPQQQEAQNQVVADFNASQDEIELSINVVVNQSARDTLATLIASGNSPDIIGPVGVGGSNAFADQWADLQPLVDASGFDLSGFDPALVDLYRTDDGQLLGIPFLVFPAVTYFNRGLFDEAGLNYPPQEFGAPYVMPDGTEMVWDYNTAAEIAKILTVDVNGNDATMEGFDPENIVQFGFNMQWARVRLIMTNLQPEVIYDAEGNSVDLPDSWYSASQWVQDAIWKWHIWPNAAYESSELLQGGGGAFSSGNLAMAVTPLWYTCCLADSITKGFEFDIAVVPRSLDGEYRVATDADTFRMTKGSANPEAAFAALSYILTEGAGPLSLTYGGYPALPAYQQAWIEGKDAQYPFGVNWSVAQASLAYNNPGPAHHEAFFPNWQKGTDRHDAFWALLTGETGATVDVAAELDQLEADWNAIVNE
jgi:multiple sugar transport system substrate-binding protein